MTRVLWGPEQVWGEGWTGKGFLPPGGAGLAAEPRKADSVLSIAATQHRRATKPLGKYHKQPGRGAGGALLSQCRC